MTALIIPTNAPAVTGPAQGRWTYADWETLPNDGNQYEVIDGVLYMTTAPSNFHQWIVLRLYRFIGMSAEDQQLAYVFTAPVGVLMPGCDPVQPDFLVVLHANSAIIHDGRIHGVPDLIVEVQSPGNAAYDEKVKLVAYAQASVPEYLIVKPQTRTVLHYRLQRAGRYTSASEYQPGDTLVFDCLPTLPLKVADLFAGAPDTTL